MEIIAVAIGNNVNMPKLEEYATNPKDVYLVSSYETFNQRMEKIAEAMCKDTRITSKSTCKALDSRLVTNNSFIQRKETKLNKWISDI